MQSLTGKTTGGSLTAAEWNQLPQEIQNLITDLGITLSGSDLDQLGKAISAFAACALYYTCTGAGNAYVLTPIGSRQGPANYQDGMEIRFRPNHNNTGASTVNVNSLGVKDLKREDGTDVVTGDLLTGHDIIARYDSSSGDFFIYYHALIAEAPGVIAPRGYIDGFITKPDAVDTDHYINIQPGVCRDDTNSVSIELASEITKRNDVGGGWVAGDDQCGFPSGLTLSANTFYHIFVISKLDGTTDAGFDTSLTAANLLADATGYSYYRRIGTFRTDGTSDIIDYDQFGDKFTYATPVLDYSATSQDYTGSVTITLDYVPTGYVCEALLRFANDNQSNENPMLIRPLTEQNQTPSMTVSPLGNLVTTQDARGAVVEMPIRVNASAQFAVRILTDASTDLYIVVIGWIDPRGKNA